MLPSIDIVACLAKTLLNDGFDLARWHNILDDYFDNMFVR